MKEHIRSIQITGPGAFEYVTVDPPQIGRDGIIVRPMYLAMCGSDIFKLHYEPVDSYPRPVGVTGHEMVGEIESCGADVTGLEPGMKALVLAPDHDAMTERFLARPEWVLPFPGKRSALEYLMAQQLGTVIFACKRLPSVIGTTAAIIGQGSVGLFFAAFLRRLGVERIIAMDVVPHRLELSAAYGVDVAVCNREVDAVDAVSDFTGGSMADLVIEAAGEVETINLAPSLVRDRGTILLFGVPHVQQFSFDYWTFFRRFATTITNSGAMIEPGTPSIQLALDLIERGAIDVSGIVSHRIPFDRLAEAYELARTKSDGAQKVVVEMPGAQPR